MSVIYMVHPVHGAKVATMEAEAIYDESHGWVRYNPETPEADTDDAVVNEMAEPKRRGRRRAVQED